MTSAVANPPIRILVVSSDNYPPFRVDVSVLFAGQLASRNFAIDWILQSEAACQHGYVAQWGGGQVWVGATDLGDSLPRRIWKHVLGIANDLKIFSRTRRGNYDAIEVKDKFLAGIFALLASRLYRVPFIFWLSYPYPEHYLSSARDGTGRYRFLYTLRGLSFKWLLYRLLLPAADHVFVQSEQMRQDVAAEGISAEKITPVPMGVDLALGHAPDLSQQRTLLPPGAPCILYLGALNRVRRIDFLVRAFALVRQSVPTALLYLVGRGEDATDERLLHDEVARLGLGDSVVFVGQLPQAKALQYVQEADVCASPLYPSPVLRAASPTKLVEYMALAKPSVANDHPEQKRVLDASGGGYSVPYDEGAFAQAIVTLLKDPEAARSMGQRGRQWAIANRNYRVIADAVETQLRAVAKKR
jgi:glycosyltransferase involved in cell wall biosynthesis